MTHKHTTLQKNLLKASTLTRGVLSIFLILLYSCSEFQQTKVLNLENPIPVEKAAEIVPDTSLHQANISEWNNASIDKRMSNCASFVLASVDTSEVGSVEKLNELTEELFTCIDRLTRGMLTMNADAAVDVAERCLCSMGYREEIEDTSLN